MVDMIGDPERPDSEEVVVSMGGLPFDASRLASTGKVNVMELLCPRLPPCLSGFVVRAATVAGNAGGIVYCVASVARQMDARAWKRFPAPLPSTFPDTEELRPYLDSLQRREGPLGLQLLYHQNETG